MDREFFEAHSFTGLDLPFYFEETTLIHSVNHDTNWHPNIEILYVAAGCGVVTCGKTPYRISEGDIFIINSNLPHGVDSETKIKYYFLIPDRDFCILNGIDTCSVRFKQLVHDDAAVKLYRNIIDEYSGSLPHRSAGVRHAVMSLILYLARSYTGGGSTGVSAEKDENLRLAIGYMYSNFNKQLTLEDIAAQVGLSKYYFGREFKRLTGETPFEFIHRIRCEYAKKMMSYGVKSVQEICDICGFESASYFAKIFKRYVGCSPNSYAKSVRYAAPTTPASPLSSDITTGVLK